MLASADAIAERRESDLWLIFRRLWSQEQGRWRDARDEELAQIREHLNESKRLAEKASRIAKKAARVHQQMIEQERKFYQLLGSIVTEEVDRASELGIEEIYDDPDTMSTADE